MGTTVSEPTGTRFYIKNVEFEDFGSIELAKRSSNKKSSSNIGYIFKIVQH